MTGIKTKMIGNLNPAQNQRQGLTLVELVIGIALMAMVATSLSMMTEHVMQSAGNVERLNEATQVNLALQRHFETMCAAAIVTDDFPGVQMVTTPTGQSGVAIRDTLGPSLPTQDQIVFLTYDPLNPELWCLFRSNTKASVPAATDGVAWSALFQSTISSVGSEKNVVTEKLVVTTDVTGRQAVTVFQESQQPSEAEIADYRGGSLAWADLNWPQDKYTAEYGVQRLRISIMLMVRDAADHAVPVHLNYIRTEAVGS